MDESKYNVSDEEMASIVEALDNMLNEEEPDFYAELKEAAWNVLHENPGIDFGEWSQSLIEQYPTEVVDALGATPDIYASLADMWDSDDFTDEDTGECHTFGRWSEYFATERSIELFDKLAQARRQK
ncbi:MAG: hypothetical protein PUD39_03325 [Bacteroidales bacterium]|nr:hypothetical protein [Bacteroidales bacterium]